MSDEAWLSADNARAALAAMPLESTIRGIPIDRFVARLKSERALFDGDHIDINAGSSWLLALVVADGLGGTSLMDTLASLALQSCPDVRCVVVPGPGVDFEALRSLVANAKLKPRATEVWTKVDLESRRNFRKGRYVTFLRQGDRLHPSAAAWLAVHAKAGGMADVVTWGELQPDDDGGLVWAQRNPPAQTATLHHYPYLRNAFAVASRFAAAYPGDLAEELLGNDLHLFQIWLCHQGKTVWAGHPEYFLIRGASRAKDTPFHAARRAFADRVEIYKSLLADVAGDLVFELGSDESAAPYHLSPAKVPSVISVIIPFRDKPDLTLKAVRSISRQIFSGYLEVILVNNRSTAENLAKLESGLHLVGDRLNWQIVDYDRPFNHSEQCNVGVDASIGEVVILMNNDCELLTRTAIAEMSAWALRPDVASVGLAIHNPDTDQLASGMEARLGPLNYYDSIVEEHSDAALTPFVRECFGNTFACAAISRLIYQRVCGLDAVRFPNGYNDVEFACRTRAIGLKHIALGHLVATHSPGQSRARTDENPQKILLRLLYPEAVTAAVGELGFDQQLRNLASRKSTSGRTAQSNATTIGSKIVAGEPNAREQSPPPLPVPTVSADVAARTAKSVSSGVSRSLAATVAASSLGQSVLSNRTANTIIRTIYRTVARNWRVRLLR